MEDWQKGFPLEKLKAFAAPFKERHKALVYGAFGLTKERDVAEALSRGRAIWTGGEKPKAIAIFAELKKGSDQQDFAQRPIAHQPGTVMVKAFAALDRAAGEKVLKALIERVGARSLAVEIFEEDEIAKLCVLKAGLAWQATKISAGSEIKGVYRLAAGAALEPEEAATLEIIDNPYLSKTDHAAILAELEGAGEVFAQHYSDYNKRKSWTAFAIRGYSDDPGFIIKPAEMSKSWKEENAQLLGEKPRWTKAAAHFKTTRRVVEDLGLALDRVRFMRLRSKDGELSRHADITDREAGVQDGFVTRLHIPIRTSKAVTFYGWTARGEKIERSFPERALCYLDQRKPHAVKNTDPGLDRIHLVIDCFADAKLRKRVARAMAA